jgi:hypothetical protein
MLIAGACKVILILPTVALIPALFAIFITPLAVVLSMIFEPLLAFNIPLRLMVAFDENVAFCEVKFSIVAMLMLPVVLEPNI